MFFKKQKQNIDWHVYTVFVEVDVVVSQNSELICLGKGRGGIETVVCFASFSTNCGLNAPDKSNLIIAL